MQSLISIGTYLSLFQNDNLIKIEGLSNITSIGGVLKLFNNALLNNCCSVQNIIINKGTKISGDVIIAGNSLECSSEYEILANCGLNITVSITPPCKEIVCSELSILIQIINLTAA